MRKYLIVNADLAKSQPSQLYSYNEHTIFGTIIAKNSTIARAKAIEITQTPNPIVACYRSLLEHEKEVAKSRPILWTQPEGNPVTDTNPRGAGKKSKYDETIRINLDVGMSTAEAKWWKSQRNKTAVLRQLVKIQSSLDGEK
jgi:hypothetical protein